jgi:ATP synthase protein I
MKNDDRKDNESLWKSVALLGQVGWTIALSTVVGLGIGLFIDDKLHSSPVATLIGLLLGLAAGIYGVYRIVSSV